MQFSIMSCVGNIFVVGRKFSFLIEKGKVMDFIDLIENMIIGRAEEEGRNINDVMDSVIWELQVRDQEGVYREMDARYGEE